MKKIVEFNFGGNDWILNSYKKPCVEKRINFMPPSFGVSSGMEDRVRSSETEQYERFQRVAIPKEGGILMIIN